MTKVHSNTYNRPGMIFVKDGSSGVYLHVANDEIPKELLANDPRPGHGLRNIKMPSRHNDPSYKDKKQYWENLLLHEPKGASR